MKRVNNKLVLGLAAGLMMAWASTTMAADRYQTRDSDRNNGYRTSYDRNNNDRDNNFSRHDRDWDRHDKNNFRRNDRDRDGRDNGKFVITSRCSNSCKVLRHHNDNCRVYYVQPRCETRPIYVAPIRPCKPAPQRSVVTFSFGW